MKLKCEICGKSNAEKRTDPFDLEINGNDVKRWLCIQCYTTLKDDI